MSWPDRPEDRYKRDHVFRQLVDLLYSMIARDGVRTWTPSELREAVLLASCMYEARHIKPILVDRNKISPEFIRELDELDEQY